MSFIFEALKQAELAATSREGSPASGMAPVTKVERRRTSRIPVRIPLFVYGYSGQTTFHQEGHTVEVNGHGALIFLNTALPAGQKLLVVNERNESTQQCVVLSERVRPGRGFNVALQFLAPLPDSGELARALPAL